MNVRALGLAGSALALCLSSAAIAGDEPLYEPAPEWVSKVDLSKVERDPANTQIVNDSQVRITDGQLWEYTDIVYRVGSLADLSRVGTLTAQWLPDKGDLIVHEISILRDGEVIDLVGQGEKMEVLRRERMLEWRIIDGSLTATMAVPGLEVGDELRMRYSVTTSDQALGNEVQSQHGLWRGPDKLADYSRIRVSWPEQLDVRYQAGPNFEAPELQKTDGFNTLEVALPLEEAEDLPYDVPLRYRRPTLLQVGTFADWAEVSSTMAPYYKTTGALDGLTDLLAKVEAIRADHATELEQAVAALELVQEDIRYLLNGLNGGNYLPQSVADTWEKKYGDCKAKTVILLAVLEHLGIESEAVLVSSRAGNAVPVSLPLPGAFDHVLVRATIDGKEYYLDGTSLGANIKLVGNVPPFEYALPIRDAGAQLEPIKQVLPRVPEARMEIIADASAGADLPVLLTTKMHLLGPFAAQMNAEAEKMNDDAKKGASRGMGQGMDLLDFEIIAGEDDSEGTIIMRGIARPIFEFEGNRAEVDPSVLVKQVHFSPDRSRPDWRNIPASSGSARSVAATFSVALPEGMTGFEMRGDKALDVEVAGHRYTREVSLMERVFTVSETLTTSGEEIAPERFREERRKAARLARQEAKLIAPPDTRRRWRFALSEDRSQLAPLEEAFAKLIAKEPDEIDPYLTRAAFRYDTYDFAGALEDMNKVIELEPTADYYAQRATVHAKLLDTQAQIADLDEAYSLDPDPWRAIDLAGAKALAGDIAAAREILEYEDGDEEVRHNLAVAIAELDAMEGDARQGLARISPLLEDKPNDASILNSKCWYMGTWQVSVADGISVCTKAVENSDSASNELDSRAMMYLRNGMYDEALADLDAALALDPAQTDSVLLRGIVRLEKGDEGGREDIEEALARDPELGARYRRWGFDF